MLNPLKFTKIILTINDVRFTLLSVALSKTQKLPLSKLKTILMI